MAQGERKPDKVRSQEELTQGNSLLVVLSGPSGVGKDTVLARLRSLEPRLRQVITVTTRSPREGEVEGRDYHFISSDGFEGMRQQGELLEHAQVYGHWYGVPRKQVIELLSQGYNVLLRTDVQGAATIKKLAPEGVLIFLAPATIEELEERLKRRHSEPKEDEKLRLATARREMEAKEMFDYVVVNREGHLDETVARIQAILHAERRREPPRRVALS